ncbi:ANTAR domain-containing protein [Streptomyces sp. NPDC005251]|uniref:ANTAR domain-containing protein n=1 Tax=Streptomyces sp. NPDC005251 TaxID=3157166 RepID=UPI0033B7116D
MSQESQLPPAAEGRVPEPDADSAGLREEIVRLREKNADLQERLHAHPAISLAQGVLMERYRLPAPEASFTLLREASQRFNIKLHTLADAVVRTRHSPEGPARAAERTRTPLPRCPACGSPGPIARTRARC